LRSVDGLTPVQQQGPIEQKPILSFAGLACRKYVVNNCNCVGQTSWVITMFHGLNHHETTIFMMVNWLNWLNHHVLSLNHHETSVLIVKSTSFEPTFFQHFGSPTVHGPQGIDDFGGGPART